jgi:hypothetical protein
MGGKVFELFKLPGRANFFSRGLVISGVLLLFLLNQNLASAQENAGISISPHTFELSANAGDRLTNKIRLENLSDLPLNLAVDKRNFTALGEVGSVNLTEEETPFSLASWIKVTPSEAVVPARGQMVFDVEIDVPLSAEPGGHFGSIVFRTRPVQNLSGSGATVAQEIGSLILLKVAGEIRELAEIKSFAAEKSFLEQGPVKFELRTQNLGNVHLRPVGSITITDFFGQQVAKIPLEGKNVLPEAVRKVMGEGGKDLFLGKYTATATLVYGSKNQLLTGSTTFIIFPYKIVGAITFGLLVIIFFLFRGRKRLGLALRVLLGKHK